MAVKMWVTMDDVEHGGGDISFWRLQCKPRLRRGVWCRGADELEGVTSGCEHYAWLKRGLKLKPGDCKKVTMEVL